MASIDSSSIVTVDPISSPTSRACSIPCSVAMIVAFVSSWTLAMITLIEFVERIDRSASLRTSAATTAKPLPASPARAASIAAFSASMFVCPEISLISSRISPIFCARSPSDNARAAIASTFSCMSRIVLPVRSAACDTARTLSAMDPAAAASCWIVTDVCVTAADCSFVTAAAFLAAMRSSAATSPRTIDADRSRARSSSRSLSRSSVSVSCSSRSLARRTTLLMSNTNPMPASTASAAAAIPTGSA